MSPGVVPPCHAVEAERVHAPFTLSDTVTWPVELYCPNQPTRRSPRPTAPSLIVTLVTAEPVDATPLCTNFGTPGTRTDAVADCAEWLPAASNASMEYA